MSNSASSGNAALPHDNVGGYHHYPDCQGGPDCNCCEREQDSRALPCSQSLSRCWVNSYFTAHTTTEITSTAADAGQCAHDGDALRVMKAGRSMTNRAKTASTENASTVTSANGKSKAGCRKDSTRRFLLRTPKDSRRLPRARIRIKINHKNNQQKINTVRVVG